MQKTISLYQRNYDGDKLVRDEVVPGAEWVLNGDGVATRKWDGTCCMVRGGQLFKRLQWKEQRGPAPDTWEHWSGDAAQRSGHGWMPVGVGPEDHLHRMADLTGLPDGTYELCGPKIQHNPEHLDFYVLKRHGDEILYNAPRTFSALREWFIGKDIEGIVWHHPDGRMVKIKGRDFGIHRGG